MRPSLLLVAVLATGGAGVAAKSPAPAPTPGVQSTFENEKIGGDIDSTATGATRGPAGAVAESDSGLPRVLLALAVVVLIIFVLRALARKMQLVPGGAKSSKAVRVLSRTSLSPRQQVIVLQVGSRLIVIGDSGGRLSPLSAITDPNEVAALIGQTHAEATPRVEPAVFEQAFKRATVSFDEVHASDEEPLRPDPEHAEIVGLMDKVRSMRQQFRQSQA